MYSASTPAIALTNLMWVMSAHWVTSCRGLISTHRGVAGPGGRPRSRSRWRLSRTHVESCLSKCSRVTSATSPEQTHPADVHGGFRTTSGISSPTGLCLEEPGPSPVDIGAVNSEHEDGDAERYHGAVGKGPRECYTCAEQNHDERRFHKKGQPGDRQGSERKGARGTGDGEREPRGAAVQFWNGKGQRGHARSRLPVSGVLATREVAGAIARRSAHHRSWGRTPPIRWRAPPNSSMALADSLATGGSRSAGHMQCSDSFPSRTGMRRSRAEAQGRGSGSNRGGGELPNLARPLSASAGLSGAGYEGRCEGGRRGGGVVAKCLGACPCRPRTPEMPRPDNAGLSGASREDCGGGRKEAVGCVESAPTLESQTRLRFAQAKRRRPGYSPNEWRTQPKAHSILTWPLGM